MADRHKLTHIDAAEIATIANRIGQRRAALELGTSQSTVSRKLKSCGYVPRIQYVRIDEDIETGGVAEIGEKNENQ